MLGRCVMADGVDYASCMAWCPKWEYTQVRIDVGTTSCDVIRIDVARPCLGRCTQGIPGDAGRSGARVVPVELSRISAHCWSIVAWTKGVC